MVPRSIRLIAAAAIAFGLTGPGRAADVTADQARELSGRILGWMSGLLGGRVAIPPEVLSVAPEGENYRLVLNLPGDALIARDEADKPMPGLVTVLARPLGGTQWRIERTRLPASIVLSPAGAAALKTGDIAPSAEVHIGAQTGSGVYDIALTGDSHFATTLDAFTYTANGLGGTAAQHTAIDHYAGTSVMRPTAGGALTIAADGVLDGYTHLTADPTIGEIRVKARRIKAHTDIDAVMTGQVATVMRILVDAVMDLSAAKQTGEAKDISDEAANKRARQALHTALGASRGMIGGLKLDETIEALEISAAGKQGFVESLHFAMGGEAPGDRLGLFMEIGVDGVKIPDLPPEFAGLVPKSFVFRPTVGHIDLKGLTALAEDAAADDADMDEISGKLMALLGTGGVRIGLDRFGLDLGFAGLKATGEMTVAGPASARGKGQVSLTGFDALMQRVQAIPEAAQAIPVLLLMKGLSKTDGGQLVWDIALSEDNKLLVNGTDIAKMGK